MSAPRQAEPREMTDADVIRLAQQGDVVAFEQSIGCTAETSLRGYSSPSGVPSVGRGSCGRI